MKASYLKPAQYLPWSQEERLLLGTREDAELAVLLGRSPDAVKQQRRKWGIPSYREQKYSSNKGGNPWTEEELSMLGKVSDKELARMTGRTIDSVNLQRRRLGIRTSKYYWKEEDLALLGTKSDKELAQLLGRTTTAVTDKRKQKGILSHQLCVDLGLPLGTTKRALRRLLNEGMQAELSQEALSRTSCLRQEAMRISQARAGTFSC
jgi:hypothetical protein